ncbi:MAG: Unknown protein [uncultured Thiotrichaceae bacterium]|uniref:Uncharacterized protein n=1 Tax=uncultured Thiotrichaceae bacterium TaxID=298394 RepID=A0A6S6SII1_9GAMM|nr:MAG: Unknown protein [uncultured Thiotrichaceae bacterium]
MDNIEIIRENLSTEEVMRIRETEIKKGNRVNIRRIHSTLVELEIVSQSVIDVTPFGRTINNKPSLR